MHTSTDKRPHPMQELVDMLNELFAQPPDGWTAEYESDDTNDNKEVDKNDTN